MKTQFDILDIVYPLINITAIKTTIDGRVYRHKKPRDSQLRNIVLITLPISGDNDGDLQNGTVAINSFAKNDNKTGIPDETHLKATVKAIITAIEAYNISASYFRMRIISENIFPDDLDDTMSYDSIRVLYWTQR